ncbi:hypothetical protein K456DRAFT_481920 [Colletotrichum gloeosporioides 23]|nr:hypothetical protein K456DRAFT_481920 [Colletotrichum gloeosporioides 23]
MSMKEKPNPSPSDIIPVKISSSPSCFVLFLPREADRRIRVRPIIVETPFDSTRAFVDVFVFLVVVFFVFLVADYVFCVLMLIFQGVIVSCGRGSRLPRGIFPDETGPGNPPVARPSCPTLCVCANPCLILAIPFG